MSDYLTDEEQLDKLKRWWEENGLMLALGVVLAVVGVVGWNWYTDHRAEQISRASELYADYLASEGTERDTIEATLVGEFSGSVYHVLILLRKVEALMGEEDADGARVLLEEALAVAEDDKLADLIRLRLARVLVELDLSGEALEVLRGVRSMGLRSTVQELKGDIHMDRNERREAHEAYSAALAELAEGAQRPILEMKAADTADANEA